MSLQAAVRPRATMHGELYPRTGAPDCWVDVRGLSDIHSLQIGANNTSEGGRPMTSRPARHMLAALTTLAVLASACGSGSDGTRTSASEPASDTEASPRSSDETTEAQEAEPSAALTDDDAPGAAQTAAGPSAGGDTTETQEPEPAAALTDDDTTGAAQTAAAPDNDPDAELTAAPSTPSPLYSFTAVSAGYWHSCGIRTDNTITCWGNNDSGQTDAPDGTFNAVSAGLWHSCGLKSDNTVTCWGRFDWEQTAGAPDGTFNAVSAGGSVSCGIRTDNTITCWTTADDELAIRGTFKAVSTDNLRSLCGTRTDNTITCWSLFLPEETVTVDSTTDAPEGTFNAITGGPNHSCGIRTDNTITCWGGRHSEYGQTDAPEGTFNAVSGGLWHSCGIRTDKTITCWGNNDWGQTDAPDGTFNAVSAGVWHSCGLRTDKTVTCWGNNHHGQADALDAASASASQALGVGASQDSGVAATDTGLWELDDRYEWCSEIQATWEQASTEAVAEGRNFTALNATTALRPMIIGEPDVMHIVEAESFRSAIKFAVDAAQAAWDTGGGESLEAAHEFFVEAFRESCAASS